VAELAWGFEHFLEFAQEVGALSATEKQALWERAWSALGRAAERQASHLQAEDPVRRFLELLPAALGSGRAHVAADDGGIPPRAERWGWSSWAGGGYQAQGRRIGWVRDNNLYLNPDAAFDAASSMARLDGLTVSSRTLWKRMDERGLLLSTDPQRNTRAVRVTLEGSRRTVLHFAASRVMPGEPDQPDQPDQAERKQRPHGAGRRSGSGADPSEPDQETRPENPETAWLDLADGRVGRVGRVLGLEGDDWGEA
jgi:hypothetical protein